MTSARFPVGPGLDRVAVLERSIGASIERVWENVRDWEHLPWLHARDFASIELEDQGDWGWRARTTSTTRADDVFLIELRTDPAAGRYVTRTLSGTGAGTEIWTALDPADDEMTHIRVEFWLPGVPEAQRDRVGGGYLRLYSRLWDEDESMMQERTRRLAARATPARPVGPQSLDLGPRAALIDRLPQCVELAGVRWRLVVHDGEMRVHDTRCPHALGPLAECAPTEAGEIVCPWHGYRFDVRTGRSRDGHRLRLRKPPRVEHDAISDRVVLVVD